MASEILSKKSFARDIRPLFRDFDLQSMSRANLDLSNYDQVSERAGAILKKLESGSMPCDGAWPHEQVETFRQWISDGRLP
jgi:hypothetical protein